MDTRHMNQDNCVPFLMDCHVRAGVELISHTWDPVVLAALRLGPSRRSVLLRQLVGVSDKVLTDSLRRLTTRGLVVKKPTAERSDAVVYELSELGTSFATGPLLQLAQWTERHAAELAATS